MNQKKWLLSAAVLASILGNSPAHPQVIVWEGIDGDDWDATSWNPSQPTSGDNVSVINNGFNGIANQTLVYTGGAGDPGLNTLVIDGIPLQAVQMRLEISGVLSVLAGGAGTTTIGGTVIGGSTTVVGDTSVGVLALQNGGVLNTGTLILGAQAGSHGTVDVVTDSAINVSNNATLIVGDAGSGAYNQSGGTTTAVNLIVANQATGFGTVQMAYGTFNVNHDGLASGGTGNAIIGNSGEGYFVQYNPTINDSVVTIGVGAPSFNPNSPTDPYGGYLLLGRNDGSYGKYVMTDYGFGSALTLTVGNEIQIGGSNIGGNSCGVGQVCTGVFEQYGGTVTAGSVTLGIGAGVGTYTLTTGDLTVLGQLVIGKGDGNLNPTVLNGLFTQSGGTVTAAQILIGGYVDSIPDPIDPINNPPTFVSNHGTGRYELIAGTVNSQFTMVGYLSQGRVLQTGGTFNAGELQLGGAGLFAVSNGPGFDFYSSGTYDLQGGILNTDKTTVSIFGQGAFNQSGTSEHHVTNNLIVGSQPALIEPTSGVARQGIYTMTGGLLDVGGATIIGAGNGVGVDPGFPGEPGAKGTFMQSGGIATLSGDLIIGQAGAVAGGTGQYTLSGGALSAANILVGQGGVAIGTGTFDQSGGTVSTASLTIANGSVYNLTGSVGGSILGSVFTIVSEGGPGLAQFNQSGGTHTTEFLNVGIVGFSNGEYNQSGGDLFVKANMNAGGGNATGVYNQTGGNATANSAGFGFGLFVGGGGTGSGTYNLSETDGPASLAVLGDSFIGADGVGTVNHSGGMLTTNNLYIGGEPIFAPTPNDGNGTYNLSGSGVLMVSGTTVVGYDATGTFNQSGGTHTTGQLIVGQTADGTGTYNLTGGVLNDNAIIGDAGIGVFNNSGGTHNATGDLILGNLATGDGTYNLSATGTLLQSAGRVIVGREGTGNLSVAGTSSLAAGGEVVVGQLAGSTGTASVSGSGSLTTGGFFPWLIVGGQGTGTFTQAGTSQVTASGLRLGEGASGTGTYTLNGGTLAVYSTGAVDGGSRIGLAGTGTLTQNGGTHNTTYMEIGGATFGQGSGGSGTYNLNAGSLTATGTITVREAVSGTSGILNVAGGALSAPLIVNNDQVNYSGGTIAANVSNNASFNVSGGAARTLTGDLTNNPGGVVTVAVASPLTITGTLSNAAGAQIQADANIIVATAYSNAAFGSGNTFDHRANVSGAGQIQSSNVNAATQQQISVNGGAASSANAVISFGNVHVGDTVNKNYAISNLAGGPALTGAIQTSVNGGNLTDARLSGAGVTAGNWTAAAGGSTAALGVAFNASTAGALTGQVVNVRNNFDNTNSQTVTFTGAAYNLASVAGGGITPDPIVLANQRVGGTLTQALTITNTAPAGAFTETLSASFGTNTGNATNNAGTASGIAGGASSVGALQAGVNTSVAGLRSGTVTVNLASNEVGGSGLGTTALTAQTIDVSGNVYNVAVGSTTPTPIVFANRHVGDAASQVLTVQNTAPTGLFSEALNASFSGATGNATNNAGSVVNLAAGGSNSAAMSVTLDTSAAGARSGSVTIAYETDGTGANGNSGLAAIAAGSQVINISGDVYRLATANTLASINFGVVHVGDTVSQALTIQNTAVNDGYSEKLNASFGGTSDARITTSGSISQLAAGAPDTTSMVVGLNTAAVGVVSGTATVNFASDGTGTSGLGITALPSQIIGVDGNIQLSVSVYRLAQPSQHSPEPVTLANVRVGGSSTQALTISNLAPDDGFSEKLNASIGGATAGVTASGAFTLLAPGAPGNPAATNSTSLVVGLDTASAGSKSGTATITLVSDGDGTSGLGQTSLGTQTVNISGNVYNMAVGAATPDPIAFANRRVGDAATQALTVSNNAAAGNFSEALNAAFSGTTGSAGNNGGAISDLVAGGSNSIAMSVSMDTSSAGAKSGSVTLAYESDGTGANGKSGLAAIAAGTQTIGVSGNVYNMAVGAATPDPIAFANRRVGDAATQALTVSNNAAAGNFSEALNAGFSGATGSASNNGGTITDLIAGGSNSVAMSVSLDTSTAGAKSGNVTLAYQSDGTGVNGKSGLAAIAAGTQTIGVSGNVYDLAVGAATPDPIVMNRRVGDAATQALTVSNTAAAGNFSEALNAGFSGATGSASNNGGTITDLIAGGSNSVAMSVSLDTSTAGAKTGSVTLAYQSDGTGANGKSGLAAIAAGGQTIGVSGNVYQQAIGQVNGTTVDFGIVHVGDVVADKDLSVSNIAPVVALNDTMAGSLNGVSGPFGAIGSLSGLGAGDTDTTSLAIGLDTSLAGVFSDGATVNFVSHNPDMADLDIEIVALSLMGTVNNYAESEFVFGGGAGSFSQVGSIFTLDFGTVFQGSGLFTTNLLARNAATGPADLLDGMFQFLDSMDFGELGFNPFSNLAAGGSFGGLMLAFDTSNLGSYADDIVLHGIGHNASGYSEAVEEITLRIRGTVVERSINGVPEPGAPAMVVLGLLLLIGARRRQSRGARTRH